MSDYAYSKAASPFQLDSGIVEQEEIRMVKLHIDQGGGTVVQGPNANRGLQAWLRLRHALYG